MDSEVGKVHVNIFAVGNVLDPHVRIEGKCRACGGSGWGPDGCFCTACFGKGKATAQVRLSDLVALVAPVGEFVGTDDAPGTVTRLPAAPKLLQAGGVHAWKLVIAGTETEELQGTEQEAIAQFDAQRLNVPDETCTLYWLQGKPESWLAMQRWMPGDSPGEDIDHD